MNKLIAIILASTALTACAETMVKPSTAVQSEQIRKQYGLKNVTLLNREQGEKKECREYSHGWTVSVVTQDDRVLSGVACHEGYGDPWVLRFDAIPVLTAK